MSDDLATLGILIDAQGVVTATTALDGLTAAGAKAETATKSLTASYAASASEVSNYQSKILAALQAQYGMTEAQAAATAGIKLQTAAVTELSKAQIDNAANALRTAVEAAAIAKQQEADFDAAYKAATLFNSRYAETAEGVAVNSRAIRETISSTRFAIEGNFTRAAGSASVLAQALGLVEFAFTPLGAVVIGATLALGGLIAASIAYESEMAKIIALTDGVGRSTGTTAAEVVAASQQAAQALSIPLGAAENLATAYVAAGQISSQSLEGLIQVTGAYAAATGETAKQAQDDLTKAMQGNVPAIEELNSKLGLYNSAQMQVIENMAKSGDLINLQKKLLGDLSTSLDGTTGHVGGLSGAWQVGISWISNWINEVGKALQASDQLRTSVQGLANVLMGNALTAPIGALLGMSTTKDTRNVGTGNANAQSNIASQQAQTITDTLNPLKTQVQDITEQYNKLSLALSKTPGGGTEEEQHALEALHDTMVRVTGEGLNQNNIDHQSSILKTELAIATHNHQTALVAELKSKQALLGLGTQVLTNAEAEQKATDAGTLASTKAGLAHKAAGADYTDAATQIQDYKTKLDSENEAYGIFNSLQATTISQSNAEIESIEKKKDGKGHLISLTQEEIDTITTLTNAHVHEQEVDKAGITIWSQLNGAAAAYKLTLEAIAVGVQNKQFTPAQGQAATVAAGIRYDQASDPLYTQNKNIDDQNKLLSVLGPERQIQKQLDDAQYQDTLKMQPLSATSLAILKARLETQSQMNLIDTQKQRLFGLTIEQQQHAIDIDNAALRSIGQLALGTQQYAVQLTHLQQVQLELTAGKSGSWEDAAVAGLHKLLDTGKTVSQQLTENFSTFFSSIEDGVANSIGKAAVGAESFGTAIKQVASDAVSTLIASLVKMGEQWVLQQVLGTTAQTAATGASVAAAVTTAAAWAPAAAAVSIATFGAADAAASAGLTATYALSTALSAVHLKDGGDVNGPGGPKDDKVLVWASNGEKVMNAEANQKYGAILDAMNFGTYSNDNRFANGGNVGYAHANSNSAQINHFDFSGANFGGTDPKAVADQIDYLMKTKYAPAIIQQSAQTSVAAQSKLGRRQTLNVGAKPR